MLFFALSLWIIKPNPPSPPFKVSTWPLHTPHLPLPMLLSLHILVYPCRPSFSFFFFLFHRNRRISNDKKFSQGGGGCSLEDGCGVFQRGGSGLVMVQAKIPNTQDTKIVWDSAFGTALKQKIGMSCCFQNPSFTIKFNF